MDAGAGGGVADLCGGNKGRGRKAHQGESGGENETTPFFEAPPPPNQETDNPEVNRLEGVISALDVVGGIID